MVGEAELEMERVRDRREPEGRETREGGGERNYKERKDEGRMGGSVQRYGRELRGTC